MISVQNHLRRLSGNNVFIVGLIVLFAACSPKLITKPQTDTKTAPQQEQTKAIKPFSEANITVLIPFKLDDINLAKPTKSGLAKADMAIDFYQGFILGIDSAAQKGDLKFKLNVFDTKDNNAHLATILAKDRVRNSNLIIGPVFPDGQKYIVPYAIKNNLIVVSPLAASKPSEFNNPQLVSATNDIAQHAAHIAAYINKKFKPENSIAVIINTKSSADEQLATPIKSYLKANSKILVQEFSSTYAFETKMVKGKRYAVVVCSSDSKFVTPSLLKLTRLTSLPTGGYDISVFGHPNWLKQTYNIDQLQKLNTIVSSSYYVDYKSGSVIDFLRQYRKRFSYEPSEYAFKGFDLGYYFGKLLTTHGKQYVDFLTKEKYKGLHNTFDFDYNPQFGYINKDLFLLQYKNLSLNVVD